MEKLFVAVSGFAHTIWLIGVWIAAITLIVSVCKSFLQGDRHGALKEFFSYGAVLALLYLFPQILMAMPQIVPDFLNHIFGL